MKRAINKKWLMRRRADLMASSSDAERVAYHIIKSLGYVIIRQQPIDTGRKIYFADLYLPQYKTIVEIDGGYHETEKQKRLDKNRSNGLWRKGYHVLRLSNKDARKSETIAKKLKALTKISAE